MLVIAFLHAKKVSGTGGETEILDNVLSAF